MEFFFENLDVYKKALRFAQSINNILDRNANKAVRANDDLRALAIAISAGIAGAYAYHSSDDRLRIFEDTRASTYRCVPYLEMFKDLECLGVDEYNAFREDIESIVKMISGIIKKIKQKSEECRVKGVEVSEMPINR